jgi:hypothetical protein
LFCWDKLECEGAHIIAQKTIPIAYDEQNILTRAGLSQEKIISANFFVTSIILQRLQTTSHFQKREENLFSIYANFPIIRKLSYHTQTFLLFIIMDSARHEDEKTARLYAKGARITLEQMLEMGKEIPVGII